MTATFRNTYRLVTVDGRPLSNVISAQSTYGAGQQPVSTAEIVVPVVPSWAQFKSVVTLDGGGTQATSRRRFTGLLVDIDFTLYPRQVRLLCQGYLFLAQLTQNSNSGGTDLSGGGAGATDQSMATTVLNDCGITNLNQISGTGLTLGTIAGADGFTWSEGQAGLDFLRQLDQVCLGYATFDTFSGAVTRQKIITSGSPTAAFTFTEGVDIEKGEAQQTMRQIRNRILVTGYNTGSGSYNGAVQVAVRQDSPFLAHDVTQPINSSMIEQELTGTTPGLNCQDVGTWLVQETNRVLITTPYTTPRDDLIVPGATVQISPSNGRLGVPPTATTGWVQSVTNEFLEDGGYQQTIQLLSGMGSQSPIITPPFADFDMLVESESVVISGAVTTIYVVSCTDTSYAYGGTITGWSWTSNGTPSTGANNYYVTKYATVTGQTITLSVTDSNGYTNTVGKVVTNKQTAAQAYTRQLYLANTGHAEAFSGAAYSNQADPNSHNVTIACNGPIWGAGVDALTSTDDLTTAPTVTNPFTGGETVTALYVATWVNANAVLAGGSNGNIAVSPDAGATWTLVTRPSGGSALRVGINPFSPTQYSALYSGALWNTQDGGVTWTVLRAALGGESFQDNVGSFARSVIAMSGGRLLVEQTSGTAFSFPVLSPTVTNIVAVAPHITQDSFCCIDNTGRTFYTVSPGSYTMVQGASIPAGTAQVRGITNDGAIPGLIYMALGSGGAWKSLDFFGTSGNYYQLRAPGVDTSPVGAVYTMIGADGNLSGQVFTSTTIVSAVGSGKAYDAGIHATVPSGPFGWQNVNYNDTAWPAPVATDPANPPALSGTTDVAYADYYAGNPAADGETNLIRHKFTLGGGVVSTVTFDARANGFIYAWLNGTLIGAATGSASGSSSFYNQLSLTPSPSLLTPGADNVLAIEIWNDTGYGLGVCYKLVMS